MRTVAPSGASLLVLAAVTAPSLSLPLAAAGANVWPTTLPKWDPVWKVRVFSVSSLWFSIETWIISPLFWAFLLRNKRENGAARPLHDQVSSRHRRPPSLFLLITIILEGLSVCFWSDMLRVFPASPAITP
jgi:hypothetical protein